MRISALSERAGLPVGTVKFYLRSGLLHHGRATSPTQAQYDETHVERLRLIRALLEVGRLPLADIQRILDAMDLPTEDVDASVGLVQKSLDGQGEPDLDLTDARRAVSDLGWQVRDDSAALGQLARALQTLAELGFPVPAERLRVYADAAVHVARSDQASIEDTPADQRVRAAATAVLSDALFVALRRLAAEHQATRRTTRRIPAPRLSLPGA